MIHFPKRLSGIGPDIPCGMDSFESFRFRRINDCSQTDSLLGWRRDCGVDDTEAVGADVSPHQSLPSSYQGYHLPALIFWLLTCSRHISSCAITTYRANPIRPYEREITEPAIISKGP
jgi:hypothetical protein